MRLRSFAASICIVSSIIPASVLAIQDADSLVREAWYWQDQRVGGVERLSELIDGNVARVRRAAYRAIAHRHDTAHIVLIPGGLRDRDPSVREMAAFAAGQRFAGDRGMELLRLALQEREAIPRRAMFDAFGRIAVEANLDTLSLVAKAWRGERRLDALTALMRIAIRGIRSSKAIWYTMESLADRNPEVRWRALYVLGRMSPHPLLATELAKRRDTFEKLIRDGSSDVRLNLATMLARIDVAEAREVLDHLADAEFGRRDRDWRVLVQAVRSASSQFRSDPAMMSLLLRGLADANDHVVIAASMALPADGPSVRGLDVRDSVRSALWALIPTVEGRAPLVTGEAMVAMARFSPSDVEDLRAFVDRRDLTPRLRAKALEAFAMAPTASGWASVANALNDPVISVSMAAWDHSRRFLRQPGLGAIVPDVMTRGELSAFVAGEAEAAFDRHDMGISTVVASLFSDSSVIALLDSGGQRDRVVDALAMALGMMKIPDDVEAIQAALQALGALGGPKALGAVEGALSSVDRSVVETAVNVLRSSGRTDAMLPEPSHTPEHVDLDWQLLRALGPMPRAEIETERGTVLINLLPEDAPFTVLSFVRLARSGYFDGLTFHRVVPNFVVQGGDPRGDGWGGPGYAIRTEVTTRTYERGSVGMASAGRDTEGSQFFLTHLPTPHLDARYTIFAHVVKGIDVVDRLQVGDVIRGVRIVPGTQRGARSR